MTSPLLFVTLGTVLSSLASAQSLGGLFSPGNSISLDVRLNGRGGMDPFAMQGGGLGRFTTAGGGMDTFVLPGSGGRSFGTSGGGIDILSPSRGAIDRFSSPFGGMDTFGRGGGLSSLSIGGAVDPLGSGGSLSTFSSSRGGMGSPSRFGDSFSTSGGGRNSFSRSGGLFDTGRSFNRRGTGGMFGMSRGSQTDHSHHRVGGSTRGFGSSRLGIDRGGRTTARLGFNGRSGPPHLGTTEDGQEGYYGAIGGQGGFSYWSGAGAGEFYSDGGIRAGIPNGYGTGSLQMFLHRLRTGTNEPFPHAAAGMSRPGGFPRPGPPPLMGMPPFLG